MSSTIQAVPAPSTPSAPAPLRTPNGLRARGKRLWRAVVVEFDPGCAEVELLEQACRAGDDLDRLTSALAVVDDLMICGSSGQLRPHPLLREVRETRKQYADLLARLGLEVDGWADLTPSQRARRAARARWDR